MVSSTSIILIIACIINLFSTVISMVINISQGNSIKRGGQKTLILSYLISIFILLILGFNLYFTVKSFQNSSAVRLLEASCMLSAAVVIHLTLIYRKHLADSLKQIDRQLSEQVYNRNKLMSVISHEMRTPMNTIVGISEIMKNDSKADKRDIDNLDAIVEASASLLNVVNNLNDYVKIESGKLDIIESDYNTKDVILELSTRIKKMLSDTSVEFLLQVDNKLPSILHGDDVRILQAVSNILLNAGKFTNIGVITLSVSAEFESSSLANIKFEIDDTGNGISEDEVKQIFMPTINLNAGRNSSNKGAGLGLFISKGIVDSMNGRIEFTSKPNVGTKFTVIIPQTVVDPTGVGDLKNETSEKKKNRFNFTAPMGKILVVDDNIVNLFVAKELLGNYEIEVTTTTSGQSAINMLKDNIYDLIFMDYVMPGLDGHETLLKIREEGTPYFKNIPIIALTAQASVGGEKMYIEEGFQGYLSKPIDVFELEKMLIKFLPPSYICYKNTDVSVNIEDKAWYKRLCSVLVDFDVKAGLANCNNEYNSYVNLLRAIVSDSYGKTEKLLSFANKADMENYGLLIHSLKTITASVGDMKLSFICEEHENAVKNKDITYINNHINTLISEYNHFINLIDTFLQREN